MVMQEETTLHHYTLFGPRKVGPICKKIGANSSYTQHFSTHIQHNLKNSKYNFYSENKNLE